MKYGKTFLKSLIVKLKLHEKIGLYGSDLPIK